MTILQCSFNTGSRSVCLYRQVQGGEAAFTGSKLICRTLLASSTHSNRPQFDLANDIEAEL